MTEIAQALLWAEAYRKQPWEGLDRLADRFNLPDLADLARAMAQAGDGARIRDSLEAKASSLRLKETAALEDAAAATTQKMLLPGVLLMAGYGAPRLLSRPRRLHRRPHLIPVLTTHTNHRKEPDANPEITVRLNATPLKETALSVAQAVTTAVSFLRAYFDGTTHPDARR